MAGAGRMESTPPDHEKLRTAPSRLKSSSERFISWPVPAGWSRLRRTMKSYGQRRLVSSHRARGSSRGRCRQDGVDPAGALDARARAGGQPVLQHPGTSARAQRFARGRRAQTYARSGAGACMFGRARAQVHRAVGQSVMQQLGLARPLARSLSIKSSLSHHDHHLSVSVSLSVSPSLPPSLP